MPEGKTVAESRAQLTRWMGLSDGNGQGNVHGGVIMKLVDETAALAAIRHAQMPVVTIAVDSMTFKEPVFMGSVVTVTAELTYVGNTSMEIRADVVMENPLTGVRTHTNTAYLVFVALDNQGHPHPVPRLLATTPEEEAEMREAKERQAYRQEQRNRDLQRLKPTSNR